MTVNEHDSSRRAARYAQHVTDLCTAFRVLLIVRQDLLPEDAAAGIVAMDKHRPHDEQRRVIFIHPVVDESTYAVALHELGHCLHPLGRITHSEGSKVMRKHNRVDTLRDMRLKLLAEESAWEWAHQYALDREWTPLMQSVENYGLNEYRAVARKLGIK